jgi:thiamine-monophosphate kinase
MKEFELIERLTRSLHKNTSMVTGPGDDCAVLDLGIKEHLVLFKTDAVVQGVHFLPTDPPQKVGHKALARCLSDVAAMGGTPTAALVTLALPDGFEASYAEGLYEGMDLLARRFDVAIAGGETVRNPERLLLSVSVLGLAVRGKVLHRCGAQPGDAIFVTGELGGSAAGKHLDFEPRLPQASWLTENFSIHSMIDLSDGLAGDLPHILKASGVGAELLAASIPVSREARRAAKSSSSAKPPLVAALTDGEDFELLFTVASASAVPLLDGWKTAFPDLRLSCIGKITAAAGLVLRDKQGVRSLTDHGYQHFA